MAEQQRLLVPLDGSELAEAAIPYAEALARVQGGELRFLAVVEPEPGGPFALAPEIRDQLAQEQQRFLGEYLETLAQQSRARGVPADTETVVGDATDEILAAALPPAASLLVMATHGRGGLQRLFLGSVADKVMRLATCATLLVSPREDRSRGQPVQLRRIAVPLDGSALAEAALAPASTLAAAAGAQLLLVRVEPELLTATMAYPYVPTRPALQRELEQEAARYLEEVHHRLPGAVATERVVLPGAPALTLATYLQEQAIDLVVMTTHGRGGLRRLVLGSTADRLIRLGLPVLLIRPAR